MAGSKDTHSRGGDAPLSGAFGEVQKLRVRVAGAPEQACAGAAHPAPSGWHLRMLHADWQIDGLQQEHLPRNLPSAPSQVPSLPRDLWSNSRHLPPRPFSQVGVRIAFPWTTDVCGFFIPSFSLGF